MNDRERLMELIRKAKEQNYLDVLLGDVDSLIDMPRGCEYLVDYLLSNGVIVPPCKVGDTVYEIEYDLNSGWWEGHPFETKVKAICILTENDYYPLDRVGKDVFLNKELAEEALKNEQEKL